MKKELQEMNIPDLLVQATKSQKEKNETEIEDTP